MRKTIELITATVLFAFCVIAFLAITACGVQHTADGKVETEAKGEVVIDIRSSTCDDDRFTPEQKLECIDMMTSPSIDADVQGFEGITGENSTFSGIKTP